MLLELKEFKINPRSLILSENIGTSVTDINDQSRMTDLILLIKYVL